MFVNNTVQHLEELEGSLKGYFRVKAECCGLVACLLKIPTVTATTMSILFPFYCHMCFLLIRNLNKVV